MEQRQWPMVLMTIVLLGLIYNFLNTIFKSDIKRFSHDRIYVDYSSTRKSRGSSPVSGIRSPLLRQQMEFAEKRMNVGRVAAAAGSYNRYMVEALSKVKLPPSDKPKMTPQYEEAKRLATQDIPGLDSAKRLFETGKFDEALAALNELLPSVNENDVHHRIQIYDMLAESYFKANNKDYYVQNKVKYVKGMKKLRELVSQVYPNRTTGKFDGWITTEEATQNLLKIRGFAEQNLRSEERENMVRRAEWDLSVSRDLNN